jgi:hypothetical protein
MTNKHTNRSYMPHDKKGIFIWAGNHITGLEDIGASLGVPDAFTKQAREDWQHIGDLYGYRSQAEALARKYTQAIDRAEWDTGGEQIIIQPVKPAELGDKTIKLNPGLLRRLLGNIDSILGTHPNLPDETKRQLFILPVTHPAPDPLGLNADAKSKFTGGVVKLTGLLPRPAVIWHVVVDRSDGKGKVDAGFVVGAEFTDDHPLPDKPTAWTYTVELRDKHNQPVGKVSVTSITVWKGIADQGPEAGQ